MPNYVAFLRGVNSGKNPTVKMDDLKKTFFDLRLLNVDSIQASGNILFDLPDPSDTDKKENRAVLEKKIEAAIEKNHSFQPAATIRTKAEIEHLLEHNPFTTKTNDKDAKPNVTFLKTPDDDSFKLPFTSEDNVFTILGKVGADICSTVDITKGSTLDLMKKLDEVYGKENTTRTLGTVERIFGKM